MDNPHKIGDMVMTPYSFGPLRVVSISDNVSVNVRPHIGLFAKPIRVLNDLVYKANERGDW